jgi:hypothetical protein
VRRGVVALLCAALAWGAFAVTAPSAVRTGTLAGVTQISFGCPGPAREDGPTCQPWHAYPHARFRVVRLDANRSPLSGTARIVTSDAQARFRLLVRIGVYRLTPLPQAHTRGGPSLTVRVVHARATHALVRFVGVPQMV